jgi:AraC family transcriptional regulator of adaptative response/methylated-DNA-[protein]-cysteine methyltransferase
MLHAFDSDSPFAFASALKKFARENRIAARHRFRYFYLITTMNSRRARHATKTLKPTPAMWRAIAARDAAADGKFVFGVRSTGIYCKPHCPARRPLRKNVVFFALAAAAEDRGFRACKRCKPNTVRPSDPRVAVVARVCREIENRIKAESDSLAATNEARSRLTLESLARIERVSADQLERSFKSVMGISPRQYADAHRMRHLKHLLQKGDDVTTALYDAGFGSSSRLYERAPSQLGMTPATYRQGGKGMDIQYAISDSPLGRLLVAATAKGVSAVYIGDRDAALKSSLEKEYPRASLAENKNGMQKWVRTIVDHLRGREPHLDLPTDVQATAFQRRVWEELRRIPYGSTRTYSQVANAIGRPRAIRAVARACATNPTSIVVPCHRVVRSDGNLAGYRWGTDRKAALLKREAAESDSKPQDRATAK